MMPINLSEIGQKVLELAKRHGAEQAEAYVEKSSTVAVYIKDQSIENLTSTETAGIALRVLNASSMGFGSTNSFDDESLTHLVKSTTACANGSSRDEFNCLAEPLEPSGADLDVFDEKVLKVALEDKIKRGLLLESSARALDERVKRTAYVVYADGASEVGIFNTLGVAQEFSHSSAHGVSWIAAIDGNMVESGLCERSSTKYDALDCEAIGREAAARAITLLGGRQVPSGKMPILLDGIAGAQFLSFFARLVSADGVQKGKSMLADKIGERVAGDLITIYDDGLMVGGVQTAPVDAVGVPTRKTAIVENGQLKSFVYDSYCAKRGKTSSTGNSKRAGYVSPPAVGTTNFHMVPGSTKRKDMAAEMGDGIFVSSIRDLFAGIDSATGDFSIPAQGIMFVGGKAAYPVKSFQISGNLFKMLSDVRLIGDEVRWWSGARFGCPDLLISGLYIAGS